MAQFSVNAQRFDPYKNFKFRVKWDGRYVAGVSKVGALKRTTEVVKHREGGDPSSSRKSPGPHRVRGDHARARRHPRHRVREVGQQGLELRLRAGRRGLAQGLPQGHHHRGLQRGRPARDRLQGLPLLGLGVPGAARPRRQRQRGRDPAHQARERRLGARLRRGRADRAELHRAGELSAVRCACSGLPTCSRSGSAARARHALDRSALLCALGAAGAARPTASPTCRSARSRRSLLQLRAASFGAAHPRATWIASAAAQRLELSARACRAAAAERR